MKSSVGKRKRKRVCLDKVKLGARGFLARTYQHRVSKIDTQYRAGLRSAGSCGGMREGESEIARPTTDVQNASARTSQDMREAARQALSPKDVKAQREEMIQQIITRSDPAEHLAHFTRSIRFVPCSGRTRAGHRGWGGGTGGGHRDHCRRARSSRTSETSLGATGPKVSALPILRLRTRRNLPARVFLSEYMMRTSREGSVRGKAGSGPRCHTRASIRRASSDGNSPMSCESRAAAIIPQPTASPCRYLR